MANFTTKQNAYIAARAQGIKPSKAALHAGYAASAAAVTASTMEKRTDVQRAIRAAKKNGGVVLPNATGDLDDDKPVLKSSYKDSLDFMMQAMNNPRLANSVRFEAAKQLLPYQFGRIGEKGKKENAQDAAEKASKGGRFKPKAAPPKLSVVR